MANKKMEDKERILRYLLRIGSLCNTYKISRELDMERGEVLEILHELAKEGKVRLRSGSVKAIIKELSGEEMVRTKSEVEELKERIEKLEKLVGVTFSQLREAIQIEYPKDIKRKSIKRKQSK